MFKRISALLVTMLIILSSVTVGFAYETSSAPRLVMGRTMEMPTFKAGEEVRLSIPVDNDSTMKARRIIMYPVIENPNDFPFEIETSTIKRNVGSISGQSREKVPFYLKVKENAEDKVYTIKFTADYETEMGSFHSDSENLYIRIVNDKLQPNIRIADVKLPSKELPAGNTSTINISLNNMSDLNLKDIEAKIEGFNNQITLADYMDTKRLSLIKSKEYANVRYEIKVDSEIEAGTYNLTLNLKYKDKYDKVYEQKQTINLPIAGGSSSDAELVVENIKLPKEASGNETFNLGFELRNTSQYDIKGVKVIVDPGQDILPKTSTIKTVGSIKAGEIKSLNFSLFPKEGTEARNYNIKIQVEYKISANKIETFEQYTGIFVNDKGISQNPKVIIDNYSYGKEFIAAGEEFDLNMSLFNTNGNKSVRNVKVTLKAEDGVFSPVGSSNSFFIESIGNKARINKAIKLKTKPDAQYQDYNIVVSMDYEDGSGTKFSADETIGIPVMQASRLVLSDIQLPDETFVNTPASISVDFYNMGRSRIRNLIINTKGDFQVKKGTLYVGNLEAGSDNYYDVSVVPQKEGEVKGKIIFNFDDEVGNQITIEKDIVLNAKAEPEIEMPDMPQMEEKKPSKTKWIVGLIVLLGTGFFFYKKRKKKLEEVGIDE